MLTWNIEWFPKSGGTTVAAVGEAIEALDVDLLALQEITDLTLFQQMIDGIPGYTAFYESDWFAGLAYVYNSETVEIVDIYEIYKTEPYWSAFPRSPVVMELTFNGASLVVINNHFKCCGDGILDLSDPGDEETRRYTASNLLKEFIDDTFPDERVIVLGDLNDSLTDGAAHNVFQSFLDDPGNYGFADWDIAWGSSSDWSYPTWPSHLDHLLMTNELFEGVAGADDVQVLLIDDYLPGGWSEYDATMSDHRPVALRLSLGGCPTDAPSTETVRLGTPPNPHAFLAGVTSGPALGSTWDPVLDHTTFMPGAVLDFVAIGVAPSDIATGLGTVLCGLAPPIVVTGPPGVPFALPIVDDCAHLGTTLCTQGGSVDALVNIQLANALDITIGTL
ncbi:MAG: endonuclease/exonuclease/phosphatase family protein [Planctomycetota bacterium]